MAGEGEKAPEPTGGSNPPTDPPADHPPDHPPADPAKTPTPAPAAPATPPTTPVPFSDAEKEQIAAQTGSTGIRMREHPWQPITPEQRAEVERLLRMSVGLDFIIQQSGVGEDTVRKVARQLKLKPNTAGRAPPPPTNPPREPPKTTGDDDDAGPDEAAQKTHAAAKTAVFSEHMGSTKKRAAAIEIRVHEVGEYLIAKFERMASALGLGVEEFIEQKVKFWIEHGDDMERLVNENEELTDANNALALAVVTACNRTAFVQQNLLAAKLHGYEFTEVELDRLFDRAKDLYKYPEDPKTTTAPMNRSPSEDAPAADAPRRDGPVGAGEAPAGEG